MAIDRLIWLNRLDGKIPYFWINTSFFEGCFVMILRNSKKKGNWLFDTQIAETFAMLSQHADQGSIVILNILFLWSLKHVLFLFIFFFTFPL